MNSSNTLTHCVHTPRCCDFLAHLVSSAKDELDRPAQRLRGTKTIFPTSHVLTLRWNAPFLPATPRSARSDLSDNSKVGAHSGSCRTTNFGRPSQDLTYSAGHRAAPEHLPTMPSSEGLPGMRRFFFGKLPSQQWRPEALNRDCSCGVRAKRRPPRRFRPGRQQAQIPKKEQLSFEGFLPTFKSTCLSS